MPMPAERPTSYRDIRWKPFVDFSWRLYQITPLNWLRSQHIAQTLYVIVTGNLWQGAPNPSHVCVVRWTFINRLQQPITIVLENSEIPLIRSCFIWSRYAVYNSKDIKSCFSNLTQPSLFDYRYKIKPTMVRVQSADRKLEKWETDVWIHVH